MHDIVIRGGTRSSTGPAGRPSPETLRSVAGASSRSAASRGRRGARSRPTASWSRRAGSAPCRGLPICRASRA